VGERTRKERRRRKEEKLLAVFVSGRRIGQNFSYEASCCLCFGLEFRNLDLRVWSEALEDFF
jgi:hypothetical protein